MAAETSPYVAGKVATNIDDAIQMIAARAEADGDEFRVKITRRPSPAATHEAIAIFDGATVEHLTNPEPWLARFSGGSQHYQFTVSHAKDRYNGKLVAIYSLPAIGGTPQAPNPKAVGGSDWQGPKILVFHSGQQDQSAAAPMALPGKVADLLGRASPAVTTSGGSGEIGLLMAQLQEQKDRLAEERHKMELDAIRNASATEMRELRSQIAGLAEITKRQVQAPPTDPAETIAKIAAVVTPILAAVLPIFADSRKADREIEIRRQDREADREARRETEKTALMEKIASSGSETAKMISIFTDSLTQTARAMVQTVATIGELRQPEQNEPSIIDLVKAGVAAYIESAASRPPPAPAPAPALPMAGTTSAPTTPAPTSNGAAPEPEEVTPDRFVTMIGQAIAARSMRPEEIASDVIESIAGDDSGEFSAYIGTVGGIGPALEKVVGPTWASDPANAAYAQAFFVALGNAAAQRNVKIPGLTPPPTQ